MKPTVKNMIFADYSESVIQIALINYITITILAWILTVLIIFRWRASRTKALVYLTWCFVFYSISIMVGLIGWIEVYLTGFRQEIYKISIPLVYSLFLIGHLFIYLFTSCYFEKQNGKTTKILVLITILLILAAFHPNNYYGIPIPEGSGTDISLIVSICLVIYACFLHIMLGVEFIEGYRTSTNPYDKRGLLSYAFGVFSIVLFYIFFSFNKFYIMLGKSKGFSIFMFIAFFWITVGLVACWWGTLCPNWLTSRKISQLIEGELTTPTEKQDDFYELTIQSSEVVKRTIIECPMCHKTFFYRVPKELAIKVNQSLTGLKKVSVSSNIICDHAFIFFIDKNLSIRRYEFEQ